MHLLTPLEGSALLAQEGSGALSALIPIAFFLAVGLIALIVFATMFLQICRPNELLIISGKSAKVGGQKTGTSVIKGGYMFLNPFTQQAYRLPLSTMEIEVNGKNAFCKGGIRLNVDAVANVKVSSNPSIWNNAIERFLGQRPSEIAEVSKQTLEGHLRAVLAGLTPEEVNDDRLKFAQKLQNEAETDLNKLGLHLDTFNITSVADIGGSSYMKEISRKAIAEVIKRAEIAEASAEREASETEAKAKSQSEVAAEQAEGTIKGKSNELRQLKAELEAKAKSAEEEAEAAKHTARARAERELQQTRAQVEQKRLQAEEVVPAEARTRADALNARGDAAPIAEQGKAMAESLDLVREAWVDAGDGAKPIFMIQQLDTILSNVVDRVESIDVGRVALVDQGDGSSLPNYVSSFPATVNAVLRELDHVTGIDVVGTLGNGHELKNGNGSAAASAEPQGGAS